MVSGLMKGRVRGLGLSLGVSIAYRRERPEKSMRGGLEQHP